MAANDNTCVLALAEKALTGVSYDETVVARVLNPVFARGYRSETGCPRGDQAGAFGGSAA